MADEPQQQDKNKVDDYILLAVVATGKLTQIWEVAHETNGQKFAMKMLLPEALDDPSERELLKQECKVAQTLSHTNLIRCHGVVLRKTECYVLMDYFKAPNLKQFIQSDLKGAQSRFRQFLEQSCLALGHMHEKGWVHKDIKPDNILLSRSSEVRIIDFSLAVKKASGLSKLFGGSQSAAIRGTRSYMAPETIRKEASTPATDIYSLGITFYELLCGTVPFKGDNPQDLLAKHLTAKAAPPSFYNKNVTPEMDRIILKMLAISCTLHSGFRGGFIFPLFFIGATLGLAVSLAFPQVPLAVAVLCLMAAVNVAVTKTPISTTVILTSLSGTSMLPVIVTASFASFLLTTRLSLIHSQRPRFPHPVSLPATIRSKNDELAAPT